MAEVVVAALVAVAAVAVLAVVEVEAVVEEVAAGGGRGGGGGGGGAVAVAAVAASDLRVGRPARAVALAPLAAILEGGDALGEMALAPREGRGGQRDAVEVDAHRVAARHPRLAW